MDEAPSSLESRVTDNLMDFEFGMGMGMGIFEAGKSMLGASKIAMLRRLVQKVRSIEEARSCHSEEYKTQPVVVCLFPSGEVLKM